MSTQRSSDVSAEQKGSVALGKHAAPMVDTVLHLLSHGPASRTQLAEELGHSQPTLSRATRQLVDAGLVQESRADSDGPGRPFVLLSVRPTAAVFLGVKLTAAHAWAVLMNPHGEILASRDEALGETGAEVVAEQIAQIGEALAAEIERPIDGVGVSLGASVVAGRIVRVASFLGWQDLPFAELLEQRMGVPVRVANDVRAFAYSEGRFGLGKGERSFALLTVGEGIGCGVVLDGLLLEGAHGSAGTVGHLPIRSDGPRCERGHVGCARAFASTPGILARAREALGREVSVEELARLDDEGEERIQAILREAAEALGVIAGSLLTFIDPSLVVVSGESVSLFGRYESTLRAAMKATHHWSAPTPQLRLRPFTFSDWARGAATLAVEPWALSLPGRQA